MPQLIIFGIKTFQVTRQAQYTFYASLLSLILFAINLQKVKAKDSKKVMMLVAGLIGVGLSTYVNNCVVVGGCNDYSWYLTISAMLMAVISLVRIVT